MYKKKTENINFSCISTHSLYSFIHPTVSVTFNYQVFLQLLNKFVVKTFPSLKDVWEVAIFFLRLLLIETVFKSLTASTFKEIARQVSSRLGVEGNESFAKTEK